MRRLTTHAATMLLLAGAVAACERGAPAPAPSSTGDAAAPSATPVERRTCGEPPFVLTGRGVGALAIGRTVPELRAACTVLRDTTVQGAEGMTERELRVPVGTDTVDITVVGDSVWRIAVDTPRLRTTDSLGVGTPLARMLEEPGTTAAVGEGAIYLLSREHCGLSFRLSEPARTGAISLEALRGLPASTSVTRVLITGCSASP